MHNNPNKAEKCAESRCFWFTVAVSCECFRRSHSAVVCGGWHLALRHSCLPPPLLSALQWDHVVLLISQQWLYSLPVPLFSAFLSLYISSSPLAFISSLTSTCGRLTDYFPLLTSCHINSMNSISSKANSIQTLASLPLYAHSPSSLEPWLSLASSPSFTRASKYPLAAMVTPEEVKNDYIWSCEDKSKFSRTWVTVSSPTCQSFLIVFPHGHKVLQTGVEMVQNPLLATVHVNS